MEVVHVYQASLWEEKAGEGGGHSHTHITLTEAVEAGIGVTWPQVKGYSTY